MIACSPKLQQHCMHVAQSDIRSSAFSLQSVLAGQLLESALQHDARHLSKYLSDHMKDLKLATVMTALSYLDLCCEPVLPNKPFGQQLFQHSLIPCASATAMELLQSNPDS